VAIVKDMFVIVAGAYLLAGIPVGLFALLGRMSPAYAFPRDALIRWWGWFAVIIVAMALISAQL
jgi:hypothetical protein